MSTGDSQDFTLRLKSLLPSGWFGRISPLRDLLLGGLADSLSGAYALIVAVKAQARIATSTGWFLDLTAWDYFGPRFRRRSGEYDDPFRVRLVAEILRERGTTAGVVKAVADLTGRPASAIRLSSPYDCGGGYGKTTYGYGRGNGRYGSVKYPAQVFLTVHRPVPKKLFPMVGGYRTAGGGYGQGGSSYSSLREINTDVPDKDIYAAARDTAASGSIIWTHIES